MLTDITYIIRFVKWDDNVELWEHITRKEAEEHYNTCLEDSDMYRKIALIQRDWKNDTDTVLQKKVFYRAHPCSV